MKIFISWSGTLSFEVAKLLKKWLKCVLQALDPWLSSDDIQRGALWFTDVANTLADCSTGIVCLTKSNINAPWILFEAGNLLKGLASNRVCTFLIDLEPRDIEPPLSQFNHTLSNRDSVWQLVVTLNKELDNKLDFETLETVFNTYWPQFESEYTHILATHGGEESIYPPRSEEDILSEILYTVRGLENRLNKLENEKDIIHKIDLDNHGKRERAEPLFTVGELIMHRVFGAGYVKSIRSMGNDCLIEVDFEKAGVKKLMQNFAQLEKIVDAE